MTISACETHLIARRGLLNSNFSFHFYITLFHYLSTVLIHGPFSHLFLLPAVPLCLWIWVDRQTVVSLFNSFTAYFPSTPLFSPCSRSTWIIKLRCDIHLRTMTFKKGNARIGKSGFFPVFISFLFPLFSSVSSAPFCLSVCVSLSVSICLCLTVSS